MKRTETHNRKRLYVLTDGAENFDFRVMDMVEADQINRDASQATCGNLQWSSVYDIRTAIRALRPTGVAQ